MLPIVSQQMQETDCMPLYIASFAMSLLLIYLVNYSVRVVLQVYHMLLELLWSLLVF